MLYAYIGAAAVIGLLIGVVTLSILWASKVVGQSIRERSIGLISAYDGILEDKSRQLRELEGQVARKREELEALEPEPSAAPVQTAAAGLPPSNFLRTAERISLVNYRDSALGELYHKIRKDFTFSPDEVLSALPGRESLGGPASRLMQELSYDTVCRLSSLPGEEQLELLRQVLPQENRAFLEEYVQSARRFDCVDFYDALQTAAEGEPGPVSLRISAAGQGRRYPKDVRVIVDPDICEGFQVEADNVLYDYCIKAREMG